MDWLLERFSTAPDNLAFVHESRKVTYGEVVRKIEYFKSILDNHKIRSGENIAIIGDFSPEVFCLIMALCLNKNIVIPLTRESIIGVSHALEISGCRWLAEFDASDIEVVVKLFEIPATNPLLLDFISIGDPGMILFSSGSTGKPKAILHNISRVADKFRKVRNPVVAIPFLMLDHFGGINTILAITSSLGTVVTVKNRSVSNICSSIETYKVDLLPTTPSFLTMLMASNIYKDFDISSLKRITYGTEVMPQTTLDRLRKVFPNIELQQTYGLSEVGVLRSKSRDDGSLWVKIGGEGFQTKVIDDILWIKSDYSMVGYLNAPSEFDCDGWFNTQDRVEIDGDYFRILGRVTDIINVGGQKVYPTEIEDVILSLDNIKDVVVYGEPHSLLGQIVVAEVATIEPEELVSLKRRIRMACKTQLTAFKLPSKVVVSEINLHTSRYKKNRQCR